MQEKIAQHCDKIIFAGIIGLVVFTPIAIGSVHVWAFSVMELVVIGLVLTWMAKLLCLRHKSADDPLIDTSDLVCKMPKSRFGFVKTPLNIPFLIFVCIVLFQIAPLPMSSIRFLSPETYELYSSYLQDKEDHTELLSLPVRHSESASGTTRKPANRQWRTISINPHTTRIELFKILSYVTVFFLIVNNFKTRREINYLILAIILVGCFEAVYGFYEYSTGNKNILFLPRKYLTNRMAGTYVNPNHLAGILEMVIPLTISFALCRREGIFKKKSPQLTINPKELPFAAKISMFFNKQNFTNTVLFILLGFLVGALFLSQSQTALVSFLITILIFSVYILKKAYKRKGLVFAIGGLLGILLFASWVGLNPLYKRISTTDVFSIINRTDIWTDTGGILRDFPIFGTGKGTFVDIYQKYRTIVDRYTYYHAHNDYLELFSEVGLLGLLVAVIGGGFFIYKIISRLTKRRNTYVKNISIGLLCSIMAIIVHSVTDFNMFIPSNALLFSIILALLTLTTHLKDKSRELKASSEGMILTHPSKKQLFNRRSILRKPLYACAIPLAIFLSIPVLRTCLAEIYYKRAMAIEASSRADVSSLIPYMQRSISLDNSNSAYHYELGRMFFQLAKAQDNPNELEQNVMLAAEQFEGSINSNPCHSKAHLALSAAYNLYRTTDPSEIDKLVKAERNHLNRALTLNPSSDSFNYIAGYAYVRDWDTLLQEDRDVALKYLRTAIELNPKHFNKVLQTSWQYIQDYYWLEKIIPNTSESYMGLAKFFDEKGIFKERNIAWEEARRRNGKPFQPSVFEDNNLIVNGSFEYEPGSAWDDWRISKVDGVTISVDNSKSVAGNHSLKIVFDGTKDVNFHHTIQAIKIDGGAKYRLTGYIKTQDVTSKSGIRVVLSSKTLRKDTEPFLGTHDWESFAIEFDAPEDCDTVNILVYRRGLGTVKKELISGIVWIDELQLYTKT